MAVLRVPFVLRVQTKERRGNKMAYVNKTLVTTKEMAKMHRACGYGPVRTRRKDAGVKRGKRR